MSVGKLLARLNPTTIRLDIGRGGTPDLTAQDIAAGLGMVRHELGRALLARLHCPDQVRWSDVDRMVLDRVRAEHARQENARINAQLAELEARIAGKKYRAPLSSLRDTLSGTAWPAFRPDRYLALAQAVVLELVSGEGCPVCRGTGRVHTEATGQLLTCTHCKGTGLEPDARRARARRMGVHRSTFEQSWERPYKWAYSDAVHATIEAARQFKSALGRRAA